MSNPVVIATPRAKVATVHDVISESIKLINEKLFKMEMVLKTAQSQKDIEDNAPLFDASNKLHEVYDCYLLITIFKDLVANLKFSFELI